MDFESDADIFKRGTLFFLHDDAPTHSANDTEELLGEGMRGGHQPPTVFN